MSGRSIDPLGQEDHFGGMLRQHLLRHGRARLDAPGTERHLRNADRCRLRRPLPARTCCSSVDLPPSTKPLTATMNIAGWGPNGRLALGPHVRGAWLGLLAGPGAFLASGRSIPAQRAEPEPVRTIAFAVVAARTSSSRRWSAAFMALRLSGRLSVTMACATHPPSVRGCAAPRTPTVRKTSPLGPQPGRAASRRTAGSCTRALVRRITGARRPADCPRR